MPLAKRGYFREEGRDLRRPSEYFGKLSTPLGLGSVPKGERRLFPEKKRKQGRQEK
jgi:hypothetical protein